MQYCLVFICCLLLLQPVTAQTVTTYDINPRQVGSYPNFFTPFKGRLYFVAFDSTNGVELRSIDSGTSPRLEYDLAPGWSGGVGSFINGGPGNNVSNYGAISKQM